MKEDKRREERAKLLNRMSSFFPLNEGGFESSLVSAAKGISEPKKTVEFRKSDFKEHILAALNSEALQLAKVRFPNLFKLIDLAMASIDKQIATYFEYHDAPSIGNHSFVLYLVMLVTDAHLADSACTEKNLLADFREKVELLCVKEILGKLPEFKEVFETYFRDQAAVSAIIAMRKGMDDPIPGRNKSIEQLSLSA